MVLRALIQGLFNLFLGLCGTVAFFAGVSMLGAALLSLAMGRMSPGTAGWLTEIMVGAAIMGGVFLGGGMVLAALKAGARGAPVLEEDRSLSEAWVLPALVPTLVLPGVAVALTWKLVLLWRDIFVGLERMGVRAELSRVNDWANWILLPVVGVLFVPFLEALTALLLIVLPPLLLVLLIGRAPSLRVSAQQALVLQAMFVIGSLIGSQLFSRLSLRLVPEVQRIGGPEAPVVLEALARGREVLVATSWAHAAVLAVYGVCLWVFMAAQDSRRVDRAWAGDIAPTTEERTEPLLAPEPEFGPVVGAFSELLAPTAPEPDQGQTAPDDARRQFEEKLANFRARHGRAASPPVPVHVRMESGSTAAPLHGTVAVDVASLRKTARLVLQTILLGIGALMLTFGALQLLAPRPTFSEASPAPGAMLARPPEVVEVRFSQALNPAATISLHRSRGPGGDYTGAGPVVEHTRALSRDDTRGTSLRLEHLPPLTGGVYRVDWRVMAAGRSDVSYGHYFFAVGTPIPDDLRGAQGKPFSERNAKERGHRAALLSGVILLALAAILPRKRLREERF